VAAPHAEPLYMWMPGCCSWYTAELSLQVLLSLGGSSKGALLLCLSQCSC
jgi:hypothetical protein